MSLAITGMIEAPWMIEKRDLDVLDRLLFELREIAPWDGEN
jgi:hypothetical protein